MKINRILTVIMTVSLFLCSACSQSNSDAGSLPSGNAVENTTYKKFSLLYCENDSLNPYKSVSKYNKQIASLMYDPLVRLDGMLQPVFVIAEKAEFNGKVCTVTLKDKVFSDGSPVTATDVVYSEELAKNSDNTLFASELSCVKSCTAEGEKTVIFTLKKADPYFVNLLDFPIIKSGSAKLTDKNKIELPPIGSGRYVFDTQSESLKVNELYGSELPGIKTIGLISAPDSEVSKYNIEAENVSIVPTDLSDGKIPSFSGNAIKINLNNIVYLGANTVYGKMSKVKMRYAVSAALDRNTLCNDAFYSYALPANGIFHPLWKDAEGMQNISPDADLQNFIAYSEELGYNDKDTDGFLINENGNRLSLSLVFKEEHDRHGLVAKSVKKQLEAVGIAVNLKPLSEAKYKEALNYGNYDLYVAEVKLLNNMDVSELVTSGGSLAFGVRSKPEEQTEDKADKEAEKIKQDAGENTDDNDTDGDKDKKSGITLDEAISGFYSEKLSLIDIINAFNDEMPIIPLCYRCGVTVCDAKLGITEISSVNDPYFGIENIK